MSPKSTLVSLKQKRANNEIQFILYNMPDDQGKVQVVIKDETLWCTQKAMAQLFGVGVPAFSKHLSNIYADGELDKDATFSKMEIVVNRGFRGAVSEEVDFYNLDAYIYDCLMEEVKKQTDAVG